MQLISEVELPEDFDIELDFDHRTMYCEADISDMTGWSCCRIAGQVDRGEFPKPLNSDSRSPVWSRAWVDLHYMSMINSQPSASERENIEEHRDIYDDAYQEALQAELKCPSCPASILEADARERAVNGAPAYCSDDDMLELYEAICPDVVREYAELAAKWKARQAVRWRQ